MEDPQKGILHFWLKKTTGTVGGYDLQYYDFDGAIAQIAGCYLTMEEMKK